ncbi:MAG: PASTA domain-containing protein [Gaiellaceae bacterium]
MSAVDTRRPPQETEASGEHRGPPSYALQAVASSVCTVLGELLGSTVTGKLVAGILGAWLGAFLTAPGRRHGRRIVAVCILLALLDAGKALAAGQPRRRTRTPKPHAPATASSMLPASWTAVAAATAVGFVLGTGATAVGHAVAGDGVRLTAHHEHLQQQQPQAPSQAQLVLVPRVVGLAATDATGILRRAGFAVRTEAVSSRRSSGQVARQRPAPGQKIASGSAVTLLVSAGKSGNARPGNSGKASAGGSGGTTAGGVTIPSVSGLAEGTAMDALTGAGLHPTPSSQSSDTVPSGGAIATRPGAGTRVRRGSGVTLLVSSGAAEVVVPDVTGRSVDGAMAILQRAGLKWSVIQGYCGEGTGGGPCIVHTQTPPGGTKVPHESSIALDENDPNG